ncbi:acyltransferase family protein [Nocardia pseudobrasiliensis]|uniref:Peptidoglycan/LPS O-acetylase OafA/YrhL n=1 Tax=Nocardia pseudobrasiliensis TaxID=45979 RepID=A0A370IB55_9NOCA|nr:acyltransferase family protein [Nocardia pseudobrasiliensis]RDI67956.1 peptidoglycan/LPS O-acetylase OafA/YrhL [Nocardia pseudobrasiliensis]
MANHRSPDDEPEDREHGHRPVTRGIAGPAAPAVRAADETVAPGRRDAYREDLDGLRGLAIALVVVFHVWMGRVSGGVDVFLVLSGFFFTGLVLRRADTGAVGVGATLRRTARRLLPALVVVLAAVVAAALILRPYTQWAELAGQTLASLFYYQNWHLAMTWSDYLAADPSVSPLQHLWSMSVQGQFYLCALLAVTAVAWVCRRIGRPDRVRVAVGVIVAVAAVASFLYAAHGTADHQGWNYYDTFARGWELLAGAALAAAVAVVAPPRPVRIALAWVGLAGVVLCGWLIVDGVNHFPGPWALLPVCAASAMIVSGNRLAADRRPWPNRLLSSRSVRWLGDIAYPLYLWHWPILIFYLAERGRPHAGLAGGLAIVAVSVLLAWATHRWIEEPLRGRVRPRVDPGMPRRYTRAAGFAVSGVAVAVVLTTGAWQLVVVHLNSAQAAGVLDPTLYPGAEALVAGAPTPHVRMRPTVLEAPAELPPPTVDGCIADWDTRDVVTCTYGDQHAARTLAVVGNSHAEHWVPALQALAARHSFKIRVYLKMGCPLTLSDDVSYKGQANPDCRDWSREVIDLLGADRPDWVFTTGTRPRDDIGDETPAEYLDVWSALAEHGLNTIVIRDTPWLRRDGVRYKATDCLAAGGNRISCGMARGDALDPVNPELDPAARYPNVFPIDLSDAVCEPTVCPVVEGNILIYHDEHHFTASYSHSLAGALGRQLQPLLHWW